MKVIIIIAFLLMSFISKGQITIRNSSVTIEYLPIAPEVFNAANTVSTPLIKDSIFGDTLSLKIEPGKKVNYLIVGKLNRSKYLLLKYLEDNLYYVLNYETGIMDRIGGYPTFSPSLREFACLGSFYGYNRIGLYELRENEIILIVETHPKYYTQPLEIKFIDSKSIFVKNVDGTIWNYKFNVKAN